MCNNRPGYIVLDNNKPIIVGIDNTDFYTFAMEYDRIKAAAPETVALHQYAVAPEPVTKPARKWPWQRK